MISTKKLVLILALTLFISSTTGLTAEPTNAESDNNTTRQFEHVTSNSFSLVPEGYLTIRLPFEKDDEVEGSFVINNFHYYPNRYIGGYGEPITYMVDPKIRDPNNHLLYDFNSTDGTFNFTALNSGTYTFVCFCSYIWGVDDPIAPQLTLNYTITGTPMEINLVSPRSQTYRGTNISLSYSVNRFTDWAGYSLDGAKNVTLWDNDNGNPETWNITLTELSKDTHTLTLYVNDTYGNMDEKTVVFALEDIYEASLLILPIAVTFIVVMSVTLFIKRFRKHQKSA
jgi:hypothetical protein